MRPHDARAATCFFSLHRPHASCFAERVLHSRHTAHAAQAHNHVFANSARRWLVQTRWRVLIDLCWGGLFLNFRVSEVVYDSQRFVHVCQSITCLLLAAGATLWLWQPGLYPCTAVWYCQGACMACSFDHALSWACGCPPKYYAVPSSCPCAHVFWASGLFSVAVVCCGGRRFDVFVSRIVLQQYLTCHVEKPALGKVLQNGVALRTR